MNELKSTEKISGIYKIINKLNGKFYIGRSDNILGKSGRWSEHVNVLRKGKHVNSYLQHAWNKYGEENFEFVVVEQSTVDKLVLLEQKYLDELKPKRREICYNLSFSANGGGFLGHKHSVESKQKTREKLLGREVSKETRKKRSISSKGRIGGFVGKKQTEQWKKKNGERMKSWWSKRKSMKPESTFIEDEPCRAIREN